LPDEIPKRQGVSAYSRPPRICSTNELFLLLSPSIVLCTAATRRISQPLLSLRWISYSQASRQGLHPGRPSLPAELCNDDPRPCLHKVVLKPRSIRWSMQTSVFACLISVAGDIHKGWRPEWTPCFNLRVGAQRGPPWSQQSQWLGRKMLS